MRAWNDDLPSHKEVAKYWCGKPLPGSDYIPLIDLDEPECFACGWCRLEQVRSRKAQRDIWKGLERAHVVASSLGGSDSPENLALLCKLCHEQSPDTTNPAIFWRWVIGHPKNGSMAYLFQISDFKDLRVTDYRGPYANFLRGLGALSDGELTFLMDLYEADPSRMLQDLRDARKGLVGSRCTGVSVCLPEQSRRYCERSFTMSVRHRLSASVGRSNPNCHKHLSSG